MGTDNYDRLGQGWRPGPTGAENFAKNRMGGARWVDVQVAAPVRARTFKRRGREAFDIMGTTPLWASDLPRRRAVEHTVESRRIVGTQIVLFVRHRITRPGPRHSHIEALPHRRRILPTPVASREHPPTPDLPRPRDLSRPRAARIARRCVHPTRPPCTRSRRRAATIPALSAGVCAHPPSAPCPVRPALAPRS